MRIILHTFAEGGAHNTDIDGEAYASNQKIKRKVYTNMRKWNLAPTPYPQRCATAIDHNERGMGDMWINPYYI